jgi:glycosyltransferase involved in cell wall biosynthesis
MADDRDPPGDLFVQGFGVLNRDPTVIHSFRYLDDIFPSLQAVLAGLPPSRQVVVLVSLGWSVVVQYGTPDFSMMREKYRRLHEQFHNCRVIYLANDATEAALLNQFGLEAVLCQHNSFLRPEDYPCKEPSLVGAGAERFEAIYVGRLHPYKRVELMSGLQRSALIYENFDLDYYHRIREQIAAVTLINGLPGSNEFRVLPKSEVLALIRDSKVGLCLSEVEGAMFASGEYLLSGVPVVSTYSVGGRDAYWDEQCCVLCPADAALIASAVAQLQAAMIDPRVVRTQMIVRIMQMRLQLINYLRERVYRLSQQPAVFYNTLMDIHSPFCWERTMVSEFLSRIDQ